MEAFDVLVTAHSNRDLPAEQFEHQVATLRPLMNWDPNARSPGCWAIGACHLATSDIPMSTWLFSPLVAAITCYKRYLKLTI
ncbi:hypothetical protein ACFFMN_28150 [Planobispora siamensis]|uniref:Uncharacterized protein n=1 Tax=Planobispora siamensis TaxID=936338 RepID=A0A8J3SQJ5_9ACTN|nr:hypothetical protein [Planobispora siamensis]GIH97665.1 hypothetical protein Psi01_82950 [Planobispora siamensis]